MQINTVLTEGEGKMTDEGKKAEKVKKMSPTTFLEIAKRSVMNHNQMKENEE